MSLRVLLADESASIRKVFQMGLQDFGAEVKSVHNGLDVIEVSQNFKPSIIFIDILLQKKNGYEVCNEIQNHPDLSNVPVVLMWSSFMELDQQQYAQCGAKGELEKPFDVEDMRKQIKSLVQETNSQMISGFLEFPKNITQAFVEEEKNRANTISQLGPKGEAVFTPNENEPELSMELENSKPGVGGEEVESNSVFNAQMDEEFNMYEVTSTSPPPPMPEMTHSSSRAETSDEENWQAKPLQNNVMTPPAPETEEESLDQFQSMDIGNEKKMNLNDFLYKPDAPVASPSEPPPIKEKTEAYEIQNVQIPNYEDTHTAQASAHLMGTGMSLDEKEAIIRSEVRSYLMATIRDQLPSMLEKIVKEELENIMKQELAIKGSPSQNG